MALGVPILNHFRVFSNWFGMSQGTPKDQKIYNLHYDDVRGDILRPPHGSTPAAVKMK